MANIKISDLPLIANITPSSGEFPIVYNNVTYKMNWSQLNNQITASGANPLNVTGTGTTGNITKWTTGGSVLGDSLIADNGSTITMSGNITIPNSGTIGSVSTNDAITILSGGKVGIKGTPNYDFHVFGSIMSIQGPSASLRLYGTGTLMLFDLKSSNGYFSIRDVNNGRDVYLADPRVNGWQRWYINGTQKMHLDSGGNLGIGTTSPSYPLHVNGNVIAVEDSVPAFRLIGSTTSFDLKSDGGVFKVRDISGGNELYHIAAGASGYHNWYINDSLKMILNSSGNVGIGAISPNYKLDVQIGSGSSNGVGFINGGGKGLEIYTDSNGSNADVYINQTSSDLASLFYQLNGSTKLTISSGGQVIVGGTSYSGISSVDGGFEIEGNSAQFLLNNPSFNHFTMYSASDSNIYNIFGSSGNYLIGTGNKDTSSFSEKMRISSGGNVTIGTAAAQDFYLALRGGVGGFFGWDDSANKTIVQAPNTRSLSFQVNSDTFGSGTEALTISSAAKVGIGVSPDTNSKLTIKGSGDSSTSNSIAVYNSTNASIFTVRDDGNVGIGTDSPFGTTTNRTCLSVNGTTDASINMGVGDAQKAYFYTSATQVQLGTPALIPLEFLIGGVPKLTISSGGATSLTGAGVTFNVKSTNNDNWGSFSGSNRSTDLFMGSTTSYILSLSNSGGSSVFRLTSAGVLSTDGGGTSDRRTKKDIVSIEQDVLPFINELNPVSFKFIEDEREKTRRGFIAQEVLETSIPSLVLGNGEEENGIYGLDYDGILALSVKAIQEQQTAIQEQQTIINTLIARIDTLENN